MRLPLLLGFLLVWDLRFCHSNEAENLNHRRSLNPPFRKDLYPQEYKMNFPIPLVFSDDGINSESSSVESKSVEHISSSVLSRKHLQVSAESNERSSLNSLDHSREHQGRGVLPKLIYYRGSNTKPKKKIRKPNKPKITAVWGPPRKHKTTPHYRPHKPHYHGPPSHGPPHFHHGPPHPHHYHHHHHHGPPPKRHRPKKTPHIVALWKENKPGWRPKKKVFKRIDLLPAYLSDLSYRLKDGLGIISKPHNKHGHHGHHGKTPVTYHSGFYTEVQ